MCLIHTSVYTVCNHNHLTCACTREGRQKLHSELLLICVGVCITRSLRVLPSAGIIDIVLIALEDCIYV